MATEKKYKKDLIVPISYKVWSFNDRPQKWLQILNFFFPNWEFGLVFNDSPQKWLQKKQNGQKVPI